MKKYEEALQLFSKAYKTKYGDDLSLIEDSLKREEDLVIEAMFDDQDQEEDN